MRRRRWIPGALTAVVLCISSVVAAGAVSAPTPVGAGGRTVSEAFGDDGWPVTVLVAGDSTGAGLIDRLERYALLHPGLLEVVHSAFPGCGLTAADDGRRHSWNQEREWIDLSGCVTQWGSLPARIVDEEVDVVVLSTGLFDADDILFPDGTRLNLLEPSGRRLVEDAYRAFVATVEPTGADLVWVTPPDVDLGWERFDDLLDDPARWAVLREIVASLGVQQVDLPGWLTANGLDGPAGRSDGSHLDEGPGDRFVVELLGPTLLASGRVLLLAG